MPGPKPEFPVGAPVEVTGGNHGGARGTFEGDCDASDRFVHLNLPGSASFTCVPRGFVKFTAPAVEAQAPVTLVGITGRKRTGKDTVAARLVQQHGYKRMAFADNVRKVALAIDPWIETAVGWRRLSTAVGWLDWEDAKEIPEVRRILQKTGTEGIRSLDPDFWVRQIMDQTKISSAPIVITDVRFPNEADAIKSAGGVILRVRRDGVSDSDSHSSETAMDEYLHDWALNNNGTVEELHRQVDELVANGFQAQR